MANHSAPLLSLEKQAVIRLSLIMGVRMLGLFMVLPVLSLSAPQFNAASPQLIGLAIGIYGLFQAFFQLPCGLLSDRFGRKPIIYLGLILLLIGSLIAANAQSIYTLIMGRGLQGCGAVGATLMAYLSDLTRPQVRTRAMAIMGASIGFSFIFAFIIGPLIYQRSHLSGVFYLTALLSVVAAFLTHTLPEAPLNHYLTGWRLAFKHIFSHAQIRRLFFSVLCLHALMSASFIHLPAHLSSLTNWPPSWIYSLSLIIAIMLITPFFRQSEKKENKKIFVTTVALVGASALALLSLNSLIGFFLAMVVFFAAFCLLEAWLPALTANYASEGFRGATLGAFSTCQFLGIFLGGTIGGFILENGGLKGLQLSCLVLLLCWLASIKNFTLPKLERG